jgi:hypothetical protein
MTTSQKLTNTFKFNENTYTFFSGSYEDLVSKPTGLTVVLSEWLGDYQGDAVTVLKDGRRYGFLTFGYGSCSGCDALQAVENMEDLSGLYENLIDSIQWFASLDALKTYVSKDRDWAGSIYGHDDEIKGFIEKVVALA